MQCRAAEQALDDLRVNVDARQTVAQRGHDAILQAGGIEADDHETRLEKLGGVFAGQNVGRRKVVIRIGPPIVQQQLAVALSRQAVTAKRDCRHAMPVKLHDGRTVLAECLPDHFQRQGEQGMIADHGQCRYAPDNAAFVFLVKPVRAAIDQADAAGRGFKRGKAAQGAFIVAQFGASFFVQRRHRGVFSGQAGAG